MKIRLSGTMNTGGGAALFILLCHVGLAAFFYSTALYYSFKPYYWAAGLALAASIPYAWAAISGRFIPYEGHYIFLASLLLGFTAYLFLPLEKIDMNPASLNYAMKLACSGALVFLLGYYTIFGKAAAQALPLRRFVIADPLLSKIPLKLYFIGWFLRMIPRLSEFGISILEKIGIFGLPLKLLNKMQGWEITNMLTSYGICAALMIDTYLCLSVHGPGSRASRTIALARLSIFLLIEIFYSFLGGMAGNVIRPLIFILLAYMKAKRRIPLVPVVLIAVFFIFYVVPFIKVFREQYWYGADAKTSINYAQELLSDNNKRLTKRDETLKRLSNPLEMTVICYEIRKEGREISSYHRDLSGYFSRFVPRFLWPNKLSIDYNAIGREIGLLHADDYSTSIGLTFIGGLIMDNGTFGVITGMFLLGILISMAWQWLVIRSDENMFAFTVYSILIYRFVFPEDFYGILHSSAAFIIYAYFLSAFVNRGYYKRVNPAT
ncbi:MAG: hypothetical protein NTW09_03420 [Candidatus Omnitrophica bacterium]|nr:hypothetical protein [Candidatus Omnitrophota bacterium]